MLNSRLLALTMVIIGVLAALAAKVDVGVGSAFARNSLSCRIDVFDIRVSQSERMGKVRILRLAGLVNVSAFI